MKQRTRKSSTKRAVRLTLSGLALVLLGITAAGAAEGRANRTRPDYRRDGAGRPGVRKPHAGALPGDLRIVVEVETAPQAPSRQGAGASWMGRARREADRMADELSRTLGRTEYYRIGFHEGIRTVLDDGSLGRWDYLQGVRRGRKDPQAYLLGADAGAEDARAVAGETAEAQVEAAFMDLSREPRRVPHVMVPPYDAAGGWAVVPELSEVFLEIELHSIPGAGRRAADAFREWRYDPWGLSRCNAYTEFYDGSWADPDHAFELWLRDPVRSRIYRRLNPEQRRMFESVFEAVFARKLPAYFDRRVAPAYGNGFDDGWEIGAFAVYEYNFRLGYTEGFDLAAETAAMASFRATYPGALDRAWNRAFDDWSTSVRPGILDVRLFDASDDGIFRPGEAVLAEYQLANFGGGSGVLDLRLEGRQLLRAADRPVRFDGRGVLDSREPLRVVVSPSTPIRTRAGLTLRIGGVVETVRVQVSNPLEFTRQVGVDRIDTLGGSAVLVVRAANRSRRPVNASVDLLRISGGGSGGTRDLGVVGPGEAVETTFDLDGIDPLDMLAGELEATLVVRDGDDIQDRTGFRFPELAVHLDNRDLLRMLVALSRDTGSSSSDIRRARQLVLRRMRADWRVAARGRGNPYKKDLKHNGSLTALGDLVRTARLEGGAACPEVFDGLGAEIEALARELPGAHPFLRKSMRKLARRVG